MKPVDYLARVEPIVICLFEALLQAERKAREELWINGHAFQYYQYQVNRWSQTEKYNEIGSLNHARARAEEAKQAILLIGTASSAAAGAILQIAKLLVSMRWPNKSWQSKGRLIGSQHLSSVIWHARNQAMHFEEGTPSNKETKECIYLLSQEIGLNTSTLDEAPRSLAKEIVMHLGWHSYVHFADDLMLLLGEP